MFLELCLVWVVSLTPTKQEIISLTPTKQEIISLTPTKQQTNFKNFKISKKIIFIKNILNIFYTLVQTLTLCFPEPTSNGPTFLNSSDL